MKRRKSKPNAAERQLQQEWNALCAKHANPLERGAKAKGVRVTASVTPVQSSPAAQAPTNAADFQRKFVGSTARVTGTQYTGAKMLGIGQMHKSNACPVFSSEEAEDLAHMRR